MQPFGFRPTAKLSQPGNTNLAYAGEKRLFLADTGNDSLDFLWEQGQYSSIAITTTTVVPVYVAVRIVLDVNQGHSHLSWPDAAWSWSPPCPNFN